MSRKLRKSFVGLPDAKFFQPFSGDRVLQHPRLFASTIALMVQFELGLRVYFQHGCIRSAAGLRAETRDRIASARQ